MPKSADFDNDLLLHILNNVAIANIGDATGLPAAATVGYVYVSLHTADPTTAGKQNANEATYTGYSRVAVPRSVAGWTVSGASAVNAAAITFGACTAGSSNCTYFGVGYQNTGATKLLYSGPLGQALAVAAGITPSFAAGQLSITES